MATQYPLQSKTFIWSISARYLLSRIHYSAHTHASVPVALFPTIMGDDKTIKTHYKTSNHLSYKQISMRLAEHPLFNLNTQRPAANDKVNFATGEREGALGYNNWRLVA